MNILTHIPNKSSPSRKRFLLPSIIPSYDYGKEITEGSSAYKVLELLSYLYRQRGRVYPSHKYIAKKCKISVRTVHRALKVLKDNALLITKQRYNSSLLYYLTPRCLQLLPPIFSLKLLRTNNVIDKGIRRYWKGGAMSLIAAARGYGRITEKVILYCNSIMGTFYSKRGRLMKWSEEKLATLAQFETKVLERVIEEYTLQKDRIRDAYSWFLSMCKHFTEIESARVDKRFGAAIAQEVWNDNTTTERRTDGYTEEPPSSLLQKHGFVSTGRNTSFGGRGSSKTNDEGGGYKGKYGASSYTGASAQAAKEKARSVYNHNHSPLVEEESVLAKQLRYENVKNLLAPEDNRFLQMFPVPEYCKRKE